MGSERKRRQIPMTGGCDPMLRDASTIILTRDSGPDMQVLMGRRTSGAAFMPNAYVFPGGAVDPADQHMPALTPVNPTCQTRLQLKQTTTTPHALACAGIRELWEETGLVLGTHTDDILYGDADALTFFFRAITPSSRPIRFDARFFVADANRVRGDLDGFAQNDLELEDLTWMTIEQARGRDVPLITDMVLAELAAFSRNASSPPSVPFFHMGSAEHAQNGFSHLV